MSSPNFPFKDSIRRDINFFLKRNKEKKRKTWVEQERKTFLPESGVGRWKEVSCAPDFGTRSPEGRRDSGIRRANKRLTGAAGEGAQAGINLLFIGWVSSDPIMLGRCRELQTTGREASSLFLTLGSAEALAQIDSRLFVVWGLAPLSSRSFRAKWSLQD